MAVTTKRQTCGQCLEPHYLDVESGLCIECAATWQRVEYRIACPHCHRELTESHIRSLNGKLNAQSRKSYGGGRPEIQPSSKKIQQILGMYYNTDQEKRKSLREIATATGLSAMTVGRLIKKHAETIPSGAEMGEN